MKLLNYLKENNIYLLFVGLTIFPTFRLLTIGSRASSSVVEYLVSVLPGICFIFILGFATRNLVRKSKLNFHILDKLLIVYLLYNLIVGTIIAGNIVQSIYAIRLSYLPVFAYFLASFLSNQHFNWQLLVERIFKLFLIVCAIGLILYFIFPNIQNYFLTIAGNGVIVKYFIVRMTSVFWTPVVFSTIVSATIMYWMYRYLLDAKKMYLLFLFMLFICLYLTVSRGAFIAVLIGMIATAIIKFDWKKLLIIGSIKIVAFIIVGFYVYSPIQFGNWIVKSSEETVVMKKGVTRVDLWGQSIKQLKSHPMGLGLGKAGHIAARFYKKTDDKASASSTDGWYLKLLIETGIPAMCLYLVLMLVFTFNWFNYYRKYGYDFLSFVFIITVIVSVQNLVSNVLDFYLFSYLYWLLIGIFVLKLKEGKHA